MKIGNALKMFKKLKLIPWKNITPQHNLKGKTAYLWDSRNFGIMTNGIPIKLSVEILKQIWNYIHVMISKKYATVLLLKDAGNF